MFLLATKHAYTNGYINASDPIDVLHDIPGPVHAAHRPRVVGISATIRRAVALRSGAKKTNVKQLDSGSSALVSQATPISCRGNL